jgi:hypothetical protein
MLRAYPFTNQKGTALMRAIHWGAISLPILVHVPSFADDMSVSDFKFARKSPATREYVAGLGEGMDFLNYKAEKAGNAPFFCRSSNLTLNADNYMNIVDVEIARDPKTNNVDAPCGRDVGRVGSNLSLQEVTRRHRTSCKLQAPADRGPEPHYAPMCY